MNYWKEFAKGLWEKNPQLVLGLAFCPTLAVSVSVSNALWMTLAATFVLVSSNLLVSAIRVIVPAHLRIPIFITIIAGFVTVVDLLLEAYQPEVYRSLGIFIPLIVVNCIILGRAEEFAQKNGVFLSVLDGLGMGIGFGLTLVVLSAVREILGANKLFGYTLIPGMEPALAMALAPGAFFTLALMLWAMNAVNSRKKGR
ncbi:MAG: electron transport complex subunit E [Spirochaetes bacterium]|nr:electron transport complex subunit E [Spirochaetota bacterium]